MFDTNPFDPDIRCYVVMTASGPVALKGYFNRLMQNSLRTIGIIVLSAVMVAQASLPSFAQQRGNSPRLIRDAEIEELMRRYLKPIFKVAGIPPGAVNVYLIDDSRINAFVAGGQRIFIHTGLIEQAGTPNEIIGVLAHETAHVAEGHLARLGV